MNLFNLKATLLLLATLIFIAGCDDRFDTIQPPGALIKTQTPTQLIVKDFNTDKTGDFFKLATNKELGDGVGLFELRKEGILIHPGDTTPSKISFKLSRSLKKLSLRPFIAALPSDASNIKEAGTVEVAFMLDGKLEEKLLIDRDTALIKQVDLTNVDILTIIVGNADGKAWFDWLMLGVVDLQ